MNFPQATRKDELFGGKVVVLLGDFRQVLPVVKRGTNNQVIDSILKKVNVP